MRRFGHGWAIGAWFVPFLSLWRPKQIVNDVWRATATPSGCGRPPVLLLAWWLSWIAGLSLGRAAAGAVLDQETIDDLRTTDFWYIVSDSWDAVNALMAISVVGYLTRRFDQKAADMQAAPASAPAPWAPPAAPEVPAGASPERPAASR